MKRTVILLILSILLGCFSGCASTPNAQVAATTAPVYQFTSALCEGTGISVTRLITEKVSCLHDYSLNVRQVKAAEAADVIVISGGGLEDFMADLLDDSKRIDSSTGISMMGCEDHGHEDHHHEHDAHFWLSPMLAKQMATNICIGLSQKYPQHKSVFEQNLAQLHGQLDALQSYGESQLADLSCRELMTFHDGFAYFAGAFNLTIVESIEEEAGSEASAQELKRLIGVVEDKDLPAIFTEVNGSVSAANIIAIHTGTEIFDLDMCMGSIDYFGAMRRNIDTVKEALG